MNTTQAIFRALEYFWVRLDVYSDLPAVFSDRAPDDYLVKQSGVCVIIAAPDVDVSIDTFSESGRAITQDIRLYVRDTGSVAEIDDLARDIRDFFHDTPMAIALHDTKTVICQASGPTPSPTTDPSLVGRRISLRIELERN